MNHLHRVIKNYGTGIIRSALIHSFFVIAQISEPISFPLKHRLFQASGELLTATVNV
jgi:hypothetical protein